MPLISTKDPLGTDSTNPIHVQSIHDATNPSIVQIGRAEEHTQLTLPHTVHTVNEFDAHEDRAVWITDPYQVPSRGTIFQLDAHPQIPEEQSVGFGEVVAELDSTAGTGAVQIYKASGHSIHDILMVMAGSSSIDAGQYIDNFESWGSTTAMRQAWVSDDIANTIPTWTVAGPATGVAADGTAWMNIDTKNNKSQLDRVTLTFPAAQDFTLASALRFWYQASVNGFVINLVASDGTNEAYTQVSNVLTGQWEQKTIPVDNWTNIALLDMSSVTSMSVEIVSNGNANIGIDGLFSVAAVEGDTQVDIELHNLGPDYDGTSAFTLDSTNQLPLDEGGDYIRESLGLLPSFVTIHAHVNAHAFRPNAIKEGDYIAIVVHPPENGTATIFGSDPGSYPSGMMHTLAADGTSVGAAGTASFGFLQFGIRPTILKEATFFTDGDPKTTTITAVYQIFDSTTGEVTGITYMGELNFANNRISVVFKPNPTEYLYLDHYHRLVLFCQDDVNATHQNIFGVYKYYYNSFENNGLGIPPNPGPVGGGIADLHGVL